MTQTTFKSDATIQVLRPVLDGLSNSQIDSLGRCLKTGQVTAEQIILLDEYRQSFRDAYDRVIDTSVRKLNLKPTGRPAKSTGAIVEKLRRESIRLRQIQDIAGCRLIVSDLLEQDKLIRNLSVLLATGDVKDRRIEPSHGYRAVHYIVHIGERCVEVQVRTTLQHFWAELSERLSDSVDPGIKYGSGDIAWVRRLVELSEAIYSLESIAARAVSGIPAAPSGTSASNRASLVRKHLKPYRKEYDSQRHKLIRLLGPFGSVVQ